MTVRAITERAKFWSLMSIHFRMLQNWYLYGTKPGVLNTFKWVLFALLWSNVMFAKRQIVKAVLLVPHHTPGQQGAWTHVSL